MRLPQTANLSLNVTKPHVFSLSSGTLVESMCGVESRCCGQMNSVRLRRVKFVTYNNLTSSKCLSFRFPRTLGLQLHSGLLDHPFTWKG